MQYNRPLLNAIPLCRTRGSTLLSWQTSQETVRTCMQGSGFSELHLDLHQQGQFFKQFHPLASLLKNEDPTKITTGTTCQGLCGELPTVYWNKRWAHLKTQLQMWGWMLENLTRISFENLVLCWNICHWNGNQTIIYVQFYHLHILISLDSFKQLWERIFFKRNGCISKGNPRSDVQAFTFPMDFWKSARGYCWAPSGLLMKHVEVRRPCRMSWCVPYYHHAKSPTLWGWVAELCQSPPGTFPASSGSLMERDWCLLGAEEEWLKRE